MPKNKMLGNREKCGFGQNEEEEKKKKKIISGI